jgi:hypothetical protein
VWEVKKAGFVAATVAGLMMVGSTAFAAQQSTPFNGVDPAFGDAFTTFIEGGGALGFGAAALVAGAYTGIATTPAEILHSLEHHHS